MQLAVNILSHEEDALKLLLSMCMTDISPRDAGISNFCAVAWLHITYCALQAVPEEIEGHAQNTCVGTG